MLNVVVLQGRMTRDPETKTIKGEGKETTVCNFTIAVDRNGKDAGADFINCTAWRGTAEFITKYFPKGRMIAIQGELRQGKAYEKDGVKYPAPYIVNVTSANFCGDKGGATSDGAAAPAAPAENAGGDDDDFPF